MTAVLLNSNTFVFADGNAGHVCSLGSAPNVGELDVLCVNSNTVVSTPTGAGGTWFAAPTSVGGQGAYIFRRIAVGGESNSVTITTSGNHDTQVGWSRWSSINAADDAKQTSVDSSAGTSSPAHSTNPLAETNELCIAFSANHSAPGTMATTPVWGGGFTGLTAATQGTGATGVAGWVGYTLTAGTAAASPTVSWTNSMTDRYMLTLTFTTFALPTHAKGAEFFNFFLDG